MEVVFEMVKSLCEKALEPGEASVEAEAEAASEFVTLKEVH